MFKDFTFNVYIIQIDKHRKSQQRNEAIQRKEKENSRTEKKKK